MSKSRSEPLDLKNKGLSIAAPVAKNDKSPRHSRIIPGVRITSLKLVTKAEEQKLQALEQQQLHEHLQQTAALNCQKDEDTYDEEDHSESEHDTQGADHDSDEDTYCVTLKPEFQIGEPLNINPTENGKFYFFKNFIQSLAINGNANH
jgi:hypothetical protein